MWSAGFVFVWHQSYHEPNADSPGNLQTAVKVYEGRKNATKLCPASAVPRCPKWSAVLDGFFAVDSCFEPALTAGLCGAVGLARRA